MGLFDFFKSYQSGAGQVELYMEEARKLHRQTGKPIEECLELVRQKKNNEAKK